MIAPRYRARCKDGVVVHHTIVCLSSQRWDDGMWTNKQHIMSRLGAEHRVIYVQAGQTSLARLWRDRGRTTRPTISARRVLSGRGETGAVGLELFDFWTLSAFKAFPHGHRLRDLSEFEVRARLVGNYLRRAGIEDAILWVYHPGYGDVVDHVPHRLLVYDCVDNYPSFPEFRAHRQWLADREDRLCRRADLVTCTSPALYELKREHNPDNTYLVHNVGDASHFAKARAEDTVVAPELRDHPRPIVGFVGAVSDYKLNIEWLAALAQQRPDVDVVVIGPVGNADASTDVGRLQALGNVKLLGHRSYDVLPTYLKAFDVAVIPYRINEHTESVFPIKFFEFLATGKPVVVSNLPALTQFYDAVRVADTAEAFVAHCTDALSDPNDPQAQQQRIELAEANSWPARIGRIMELVEERL